jgi:hypothetical protein
MKVNPTTANVGLWLKNIDRQKLHEQGWIEVNRRFHGIARAARPFLQAYFPDEQDQEAAFDGLTLALLAVGHFEDIGRLTELLGNMTPAQLEQTNPNDTNEDKNKTESSQSETK